MTLATLIQKNGLRQLATLTVATPATNQAPLPDTVATVATVTVATPEIHHAFFADTTVDPAFNSQTKLQTDAALFMDDRRHCAECANLSAGRCLAAWRGEIKAAKLYKPLDDLPRRCEGYAPKANDPDQRTGIQRWPMLNPPSKPPGRQTTYLKSPTPKTDKGTNHDNR
jgi:hypothetical protein